MNIRSEIDSRFLDSAEQQLYEMLLTQRSLYNQRWWQSPRVNALKPVLRTVGFALSVLGLAICCLPLFGTVAWSNELIRPEYLLVVFLIFALFFYRMPWIEAKIKTWTHGVSMKSCQRLAAKSVKQARKHVPFIAEYDIKGGLINYYRDQQGTLSIVWTRKLKGVALQGSHVTLVFKKWTSIIPVIVLLYNDVERVKLGLMKQDIECRDHQLVHRQNDNSKKESS